VQPVDDEPHVQGQQAEGGHEAANLQAKSCMFTTTQQLLSDRPLDSCALVRGPTTHQLHPTPLMPHAMGNRQLLSLHGCPDLVPPWEMLHPLGRCYTAHKAPHSAVVASYRQLCGGLTLLQLCVFSCFSDALVHHRGTIPQLLLFTVRSNQVQHGPP